MYVQSASTLRGEKIAKSKNGKRLCCSEYSGSDATAGGCNRRVNGILSKASTTDLSYNLDLSLYRLSLINLADNFVKMLQSSADSPAAAIWKVSQIHNGSQKSNLSLDTYIFMYRYACKHRCTHIHKFHMCALRRQSAECLCLAHASCRNSLRELGKSNGTLTEERKNRSNWENAFTSGTARNASRNAAGRHWDAFR